MASFVKLWRVVCRRAGTFFSDRVELRPSYGVIRRFEASEAQTAGSQQGPSRAVPKDGLRQEARAGSDFSAIRGAVHKRAARETRRAVSRSDASIPRCQDRPFPQGPRRRRAQTTRGAAHPEPAQPFPRRPSPPTRGEAAGRTIPHPPRMTPQPVQAAFNRPETTDFRACWKVKNRPQKPE